MLSYCMFFRGNHPPFHSSKATLLSSMEIWELENVFASIMLPIWYKAARMRSFTNPTTHTVFVWKQRNFLCNIPRYTARQRKNRSALWHTGVMQLWYIQGPISVTGTVLLKSLWVFELKNLNLSLYNFCLDHKIGKMVLDNHKFFESFEKKSKKTFPYGRI